jgi:hypothetical protein
MQAAFDLRMRWAKAHPEARVPELPKVAKLLAEVCAGRNDLEGEFKWLNLVVDNEAHVEDQTAHDRGMSLHDFSVAAGRLGNLARASEAALHAAACFREVFSACTPETSDSDYVNAGCNLASALALAGDFGDAPESLKDAIATASNVLSRVAPTSDGVSHAWGATLNNLGHARFRLGELRKDPSLVREGIANLDESVEHHLATGHQSAAQETAQLIARARAVLERMVLAG